MRVDAPGKRRPHQQEEPRPAQELPELLRFQAPGSVVRRCPDYEIFILEITREEEELLELIEVTWLLEEPDVVEKEIPPLPS